MNVVKAPLSVYYRGVRVKEGTNLHAAMEAIDKRLAIRAAIGSEKA